MKKLFLGVLSLMLIVLTACHDSDAVKNSQSDTALLIIDVQNDYFPGGNMELVGANEAGENARKMLEYFRVNNLPVIHIRHIANNEGATFFLPNTPGAEINAVVAPKKGEKVIVKHYPNSFRDTDLQEYLQSKGIKNLVITGMMTDVCVESTTRAAFDLGYKNTIIGDACATRNRELNGEMIPAGIVHESFLAGVSALDNLYAIIVNTQDYIRGK
ncbi:cysteine hydrolase family protein [Chryseobacterium sp. MYb264]|uniref:cysteine hydrolase family protein n=1 Tax=Chryseobacterium sp. MYb264 TaxID=2745153 RepID=UPI002E11C0D5|nr:cysteine hydrolase family protein [Chryseobacterium sp. MYb264]